MKLQQDLTQGDVFPRVATFALPLILSSLLQNLYNTADMYFVGRYVGTNGLAAVSICGPIMMVLTLTLNGLSSGISVVLANYKGGDFQRKRSPHRQHGHRAVRRAGACGHTAGPAVCTTDSAPCADAGGILPGRHPLPARRFPGRHVLFRL